MGNWSIYIAGTGCHDNGESYDADDIARRAVNELKEKGHSIQSAVFVSGGSADLEREPGFQFSRDEYEAALFRIARGDTDNPQREAREALESCGVMIPGPMPEENYAPEAQPVPEVE